MYVFYTIVCMLDVFLQFCIILFGSLPINSCFILILPISPTSSLSGLDCVLLTMTVPHFSFYSKYGVDWRFHLLKNRKINCYYAIQGRHLVYSNRIFKIKAWDELAGNFKTTLDVRKSLLLSFLQLVFGLSTFDTVKLIKNSIKFGDSVVKLV